MKHKPPLEKDLLIYIQEWTPNAYIEPFHWHTSLEIGYCLFGSGWFYFGEKRYEVHTGDVFVVNNMERHIAQSDAQNPSRYLFVYFDPTIIGQGERELLLPFVYHPKKFQNKIPAHLSIAKNIGVLLKNMQEEQKTRKIAYKSMMRCALLQICSLLLRYYGQGTSFKDLNHTFNLYHKLQPVLNFMKENFREPIELEDIAQFMKLSPSRTRHLFKETIGEGFKEHLKQLRVNEAKRLLSSTDLSITEICLQCGFQSHTPFYIAFKQIVGLTPQQYREQASVTVLFENRSDGMI
jgi:AraC-like DNA-binding protein